MPAWANRSACQSEIVCWLKMVSLPAVASQPQNSLCVLESVEKIEPERKDHQTLEVLPDPPRYLMTRTFSLVTNPSLIIESISVSRSSIFWA